MGLDTIPELKNELKGYRKQLADNYLVDKEVSDNLVKEVFERQKQDRRISHILFATPKKPAKEDIIAAKLKANNAYAHSKMVLVLRTS